MDFEEWWSRVGKFIDPDASDVPWYDKRKRLAEAAFMAAKAESGNYIADDSIEPHAITFANGRQVTSSGIISVGWSSTG